MQENTFQERGFRKKAYASLAVLLLVAMLLTGTFAWTDFRQHKSNAFAKTSDTLVTLNNKFDPNKAWKDSDIASKEVSVTNPSESSNPVYVRLQFKEFLETYDIEYTLVEDESGDIIYFATWPDGAKKGEYMTYAEALTQGLSYGKFMVDGVEYATVSDAEVKNGIYGKPMNDPTATTGKKIKNTFGSVSKATETCKEQHGPLTHDHEIDKCECGYDVYMWDEKGISTDNGSSGIDFAHDFIQWNLGTQVVDMEVWKDAASPIGDFWVCDKENGWAYWAAPLEPNTSTSNIIESVTLLNKPGVDFEYYIHIDMQATDYEDLSLMKEDNGFVAVMQAGSEWTYNGDGTATSKKFVNGSFVSETVIAGLDGVAGTADDNALVNPAGTEIMTVSSSQIKDSGNTHYVDIGNGFHVHPGGSGKLGATDSVVKDFGFYAQNDRTGEVKDPIDWYILDVNGKNAILITKNLFGPVQFNTNVEDGNAWETSNLRKWLNGYSEAVSAIPSFYDNAFDENEQNKILNTKVSMASENFIAQMSETAPLVISEHTTNAQGDTSDKVFELSATEYYEYFGYLNYDKNPRLGAIAQAGEYSLENNVYASANKNGPWYEHSQQWTRTPGLISSDATTIDAGGMVLVNSGSTTKVTHARRCARPAITVTLG